MAKNALDPRGEMRATPRKNALAGYAADAIRTVDNFARNPLGYSNPPAEIVSDFLSVPAIYRTLDRLAYGEPLTTGAGQATKLRPDTVDTALTVAPIAAKWPKQVGGMLTALAGGGIGPDDAMRAATVWHGTPHKFDKFDSSKIGTGEGAQAYGHGLYLADNPTVAKSYQGKVSAMKGASPTIDGKPINWDDPLHGAAFEVWRHDGNRDAAARFYEQNFNGSDVPSIIRSGLGLPVVDPPGNLYKVDLPDEQIARMLDWDKPLSQQPDNVQAVFSKIGVESGMTGGQAYRAAHEAAIRSGKAAPAAKKEADMVNQLRKAGVTGVRYLDGGSRGAGGGTSNFVVFPGEESALTILERNGQAVNALRGK